MIYEARSREDAESSWATDCIPSAYKEFPEFRVTSYAETYWRIRESAESHPRLEVRVQVRGVTVAVATYIFEEDMHLGNCLSIHWMYVLPEYRGKGIANQFIRLLKHLAGRLSIPYSYTRRVRNGYMVYYPKEVMRGETCSSKT